MTNDNTMVVDVQLDAGFSQVFDPLLDVLQEVKAEIQTVADGLSAAFNGLLDGTSLIDDIEKIGEKANGVVTQLNNGVNATNLFKGLLPQTSETFSGIKGLLSKGIKDITGNLSSISSVFSGMSLGWGAAIAAIIAVIVLLVANWDTVKETVITVWNNIKQALGTAASWINDNVILPVMNFFAPMGEWFSTLFGSVQQTVSDVFYNLGVLASGGWEVIQVIWKSVAGWFSINVVQPVSNFFSGLWDGLKTKAAEAWSKVKSVFGTAADFFRNTFSRAWESIVSIFSVAGNIFTNIKDGIVAAFKKIVNGLIGGINSVVRRPFDGINFALRIIRDIEILGLRPFSNLKTISIPEIPYLAQGAVLPANRPFLAVVGDQTHGTNVEAPLATIQQALANVLAQQGNGDINITFTGDLAQLARVLKPAIDRESRRVGGNLARGAI